jgi:hypothetical protein
MVVTAIPAGAFGSCAIATLAASATVRQDRMDASTDDLAVAQAHLRITRAQAGS